uniref:Uncharacterized protein n=1 Tax=Aegilops tauschii subsp. strangulata TaxID=200361 RepID=A0A453J3Z3_AEGTS
SKQSCRAVSSFTPKERTTPPTQIPHTKASKPHGHDRPMAQPPAPATPAAAYGCAACGADLNLSASNLYPAGTYFEAGNKGTLSFSWVVPRRPRYRFK